LARIALSISSKEVSLDWNVRLRQLHRWLSIAFTLAVIANIVAMVPPEQANLIGGFALLPPGLLLVTGPYLFSPAFSA